MQVSNKKLYIFKNPGDNKALTSIRLHCISTNQWQESDYDNDGVWEPAVSCPQPDTVICSLKTRIEAPHPSDNTAMNGVEFECCSGESATHSINQSIIFLKI